jgi:hypothetical protein
MILIRNIVGLLFLGPSIGALLAVLLTSNHREPTLLFINSVKADCVACIRNA